MSTVSSVSNSNRITGLATGLDIDSIVKGLTAGTQAKIDSANQDKQVLEWKQSDYETVTSSLYSFMNTYCGSSSFSLSIANDLKTLTATNSGSNYATVTTSSNSTAGNVYIAEIDSLATGASVTSSSAVSSTPTITVTNSTVSNLTGKSMKVSLDGVEKTITFSGSYSNASGVATDLQSLLNTSFGSGRITVTNNGDGTLSLDSTSSTVKLENCGTPESEASSVISFTDGASNRLTLSDTLADIGLRNSPGSTVDFSIDGTAFSFTSSATMQNIMDYINDSDIGVKLSYSNITDKFNLTSTTTGTGSSLTWSDTEGSFLSSILGTGVSTAGTDAVVKVGLNGGTDASSLTTLTRSSNSFEINGATYTLKATTSSGFTVNIGYNVSDIKSKISNYVTAYNTMLKTVTDLLSETVNKDYKPLTSTQKTGMTSDEITQWNAKAKSGLLNNDSYLESIYNSLRSVWYDNVDNLSTGSSIATTLTGIGISTGDYTQMGQLKIDDQTLTDAINSNPQGVMQLLTQTASVSYSQYSTDAQKQTRYKQSGILWRVADIVRSNLSTTGVKGALITLVGNPSNGYSGTTSSYYTQIKNKKDKIDDFNDELTTERNKDYQIYSNLEAQMVKFNSLSSWLSSTFSSG